MKNIPWGEMRKRYESEKMSYRELGEAYGVSARTVGTHAREEKWTRGKQIPHAADVCLSSAARQLARRLESAENGEEVNMGEIKDLTAVLRELVKVKESMEKDDGADACVRVEMSREVEAWSK